MKHFKMTLVLVMIFLSCENSVGPAFDGEVFKMGLINNDYDAVGSEIQKITTDLEPSSDKQDLEILIERIEENTTGVTLTFSCFNCLFKIPPASILTFDVDSLGTSVSRTITIVDNEGINLDN